ncbi:unnamed protein product [Linum trigynum]|uniref:Uncharacterized protein n=1 Tax=Linum trigynum TaxID=586398 RepID=A0AAV2EMT1_9ROSI
MIATPLATSWGLTPILLALAEFGHHPLTMSWGWLNDAHPPCHVLGGGMMVATPLGTSLGWRYDAHPLATSWGWYDGGHPPRYLLGVTI